MGERVPSDHDRLAVPRSRLRPLALPAEHGAWAFLFEPIAAGLLIAPSAAGVLLAAAAVAAFLTRHPLLLALRDRKRGKRYPRTGICEALALGYGTLGAAALIAAFALAGATPLIPLVAALPLAATHFVFDLRNGGRSLAAELAGAVAPAATAAAILLATRSPAITALVLATLLAARAIVSILFVRSTLRGESRNRMRLAHGAALTLAAALFTAGLASLGAVAAMLVLLLRALPTQTLTARGVGLRELGYGALTVALLAA